MIKKKGTALITGLFMIMGFAATGGQEVHCDEIGADDIEYGSYVSDNTEEASSMITEDADNGVAKLNFDYNSYSGIASSMFANVKTTGELKSGNNVYSTVELKGLGNSDKIFFGCSVRLKYDPDVYEVEEVTPGSMCEDPERKFCVKDNKEKGEIYIQHIGCSYKYNPDSEDYCKFAGIKFKVKDSYTGEGKTRVYVMENQAVICEHSGSDVIHLKTRSYDYTTMPKNIPDIKIAVQENGESVGNAVNTTFTITNEGSEEVDLSKLRVNYYYTKEGTQDETFNCYYAGTTDGTYKTLTSNVVGKIGRLSDDKKTENADSYLEVNFNGGTLDAGQSMVVQAGVNKNDWSDYDKTNDYSYDSAENVSAFFYNTQVWGNEDDKVDNVNDSDDDANIGCENIRVNVEPVDKNLKDGDTVIVPIRTEGISERHNEIYTWKIDVKYDTDVFENPEVKAGYVCKNIDNNFCSYISDGSGLITMNYFDSDRDCIESDGVLAFVTLTVKDAGSAAGKDSLVYGVNKGNFVDRYDSVLGVVYSNNKSTEVQLTGEYDPGKEQ